ncbi:MAG: Antiseptic resistance protein [Actinomycetota bacterium]
MSSASTRTVSPARQNAVLVLMCLAVIVVIANVSSLNVAVPAIGTAFKADQSKLQWVVDAYALLLAALLLPAGAIGDRFSRKGTLLFGFVVMTAASAWSAEANTITELILARGGAGLGAAFVFPSTLSTLTAIMSAERRSRAVALWSACAAGGGIVGIIGAGAILERYEWTWIFRGNAILCGAFLVLAVLLAVDTKDPDHAHIDPLGTVLSVIAIGGIVLAVTEGPVRGWTDTITVIGGAAGLAGLVAFVAWELAAKRPLLDVRLFGRPRFGTTALAIFLLFLVTFGLFFLCVQFVAYIFDYGPLDSGLALIPAAIALAPASLLGVVLAKRSSIFAVACIGMLIAGGSFLYLSQLTETNTFWAFAGGLVVFGFGIGIVQGPATEVIVSSLPAAKQGVASAVNDTTRELGGALGIAIIGSVFNIGYRAGVNDEVRVLGDLFGAVRSSPAAGLVASEGKPEVVDAVRRSFIDGWHLGTLVCAAIAVGGALIVGVVGLARRGRTDDTVEDLDATTDLSSPTADVPADAAALGISAGVAAPEPDPLTAAREHAAATEAVSRQAGEVLASLQSLVSQQQQTLDFLDDEKRKVLQSRERAADIIDRAADELQRLASTLREAPTPTRPDESD